MTLTEGQGQGSRSNFQKNDKKQTTGHIPDAISPTYFILDTKVQPIKAHSMNRVLMTLTLGEGQRSRSNFSKKWVKNQRTGHISEAISPTDFILGTKVQPNKAHSMTQVRELS